MPLFTQDKNPCVLSKRASTFLIFIIPQKKRKEEKKKKKEEERKKEEGREGRKKTKKEICGQKNLSATITQDKNPCASSKRASTFLVSIIPRKKKEEKKNVVRRTLMLRPFETRTRVPQADEDQRSGFHHPTKQKRKEICGQKNLDTAPT